MIDTLAIILREKQNTYTFLSIGFISNYPSLQAEDWIPSLFQVDGKCPVRLYIQLSQPPSRGLDTFSIPG